jgi:hypothetical protein
MGQLRSGRCTRPSRFTDLAHERIGLQSAFGVKSRHACDVDRADCGALLLDIPHRHGRTSNLEQAIGLNELAPLVGLASSP